MRLPLSKILAIPGIIGFAAFLYITWFKNEDYALYMVPFIIYLIGIYFLQPAIDWWWYQKYPPDVEAPLRKIFEQRLSYYQRLSEENKQKFRTRVALYIEANDFRPQVLDVWAVSVVFFFSFPERFKTQLSDLYQTHSNLFNQHPAKLEEPVIAAFEEKRK